MAHDFLSHLPAAERERIERRVAAERKELARLHGLGDRWLGEAVLRLARDVRSKVPRMAGQAPDVRTCNGYLLWDAIPEMARRLGCDLRLNEAGGDVRGETAGDLRLAVSAAMWGFGPGYLGEAAERDADLCPVSLLTHDVANGSPVAILLDRVAPPAPGADDRCARYVREVSRSRGLEVRDAWDPTMQHYGHYMPQVEGPEPEEATYEAPSPSP